MSCLEANRARRDRLRDLQREHGAWAQREPVWGLSSVPEAELRLLPDAATPARRGGLPVADVTAEWASRPPAGHLRLARKTIGSRFTSSEDVGFTSSEDVGFTSSEDVGFTSSEEEKA